MLAFSGALFRNRRHLRKVGRSEETQRYQHLDVVVSDAVVVVDVVVAAAAMVAVAVAARYQHRKPSVCVEFHWPMRKKRRNENEASKRTVVDEY